MSQKERDAFMALVLAAKNVLLWSEPDASLGKREAFQELDNAVDTADEALRRYPDETPAAARPWMCDSCPDTFTSYEDAMNHERRVGEALEAKLKISPLIPYDGTLEAAPAESKTPEDKPEATRRWRCKGCGWEVREAGEEILEEA